MSGVRQGGPEEAFRTTRRWLQARAYHLLFGLSLLTLAALGAWWAVYFSRSVELERASARDAVGHAAEVAALTLGHRPERPALGPVPDAPALEVVPAAGRTAAELFAPAVPNHPAWGVRPVAGTLAAIESRHARRRVMVIGESALLLTLVGVFVVFFYRLLGQERRHRAHMESFVASVSHEMKTPLTGLKSLLQTAAAGRVPAEMAGRLFALGLKESERLEHMVENVLTAGRIREGRLDLPVREVPLRPMLEDFVRHRRGYLVGRPEAITLEWQVEDDPCLVRCSEHALTLVLENLTDNAFKYGGEHPTVLIRVDRHGPLVRIVVEDRGIGFAPEQAEALFAPFHRAAPPRARGMHGTGLGLSIARTLMERMGGTLTAASDGPGRGSRFTCLLPGGRA